MKGLLGKKIGMSQKFTDEKLLPITLLEVGSCIITDIKTEERDGYNAIQLGIGEVSERKLTKPELGNFKKKKISLRQHLREIRVDSTDGFSIGQEIKADLFASGDRADVTSVSIGKGFAGPMKRWNFKGMGASHGVHRVHRRGGSIGSSATPSRVFPGRKMAGRMGNETVTVKGLHIVSVDAEKGLIGIKGAVPGSDGSIVIIKGSSK